MYKGKNDITVTLTLKANLYVYLVCVQAQIVFVLTSVIYSNCGIYLGKVRVPCNCIVLEQEEY